MSHDWFYESGDWNVICDVCSKKIKASESKERWDGFIVCPEDWEPRQSLDFVRARQDKISVPFARPIPPDVFGDYCTDHNGIAGYAIAGCATPSMPVAISPIPPGTFNGNTL